LTVIAPGDPAETEHATRAVAAHAGPCYLRLGRAGEPIIHSAPIDFEIGKAILAREGDDLTLISTGGLLGTALEAAEVIAKQGFRARVLSMHTVKPLDVTAVLDAARDTRAIVTLEEHSVMGGLGSAVAEALAESTEPKVAFKRLGAPSAFARVVGSQEFLRECNGLSVSAVVRSVEALLSLVQR
jgi:transketolase